MNSRTIINIFCAVCGIAVMIFGLLVRFGMFAQILPSKGLVLLSLGGIILIWAAMSQRRHR